MKLSDGWNRGRWRVLSNSHSIPDRFHARLHAPCCECASCRAGITASCAEGRLMAMHSSNFQADDGGSNPLTRSRLPEPRCEIRSSQVGPSGSTRNSTPGIFDSIAPALLTVALVIIAALAWSVATTTAAEARPATWKRGLASSYGPGLYGNGTACGQTLTPSTRGVAHRTLPCGTRLLICRSGRCVHARVIDRGPFSGSRVLDLTAATTRELCSCGPYQWGVRTVAYRKDAL